jgi:hypothetical protein
MVCPGGVPDGDTPLPGCFILTILESKPYAGHQPSHEIRQLAFGFLRLAPESFGGVGPFPPQHRTKAQPFEKSFCDYADGPAADVSTFLVTHAGLLHPHEACLFEKSDGALAAALTDAGITHDGTHVDVNETIGQGGRTQAHRCQVKMSQDGFQNDLTGFPALAPGLPTRVTLQWWTFLGVEVPSLGAFRR